MVVYVNRETGTSRLLMTYKGIMIKDSIKEDKGFMKHVGIITTHYAANYGAVLQAYALQNTIQSLGFDCEIIDFRPDLDVYGRQYILKERNIKILYHNIMRILHYGNLSKFQSRIAQFDRFIDENMKMSKRSYVSYDDLISDMPQYDCFVCGSDQIWNTRLMYSPAFFLRFEKIYPSALYVAYAPSFPELKTTEDETLLLSNISHFNHLSAREKNGAEFIAQKTGRCVKNVLDPVFLLSPMQWSELCKGSKMDVPTDDKYLLLFFIGLSETSKNVVKALMRKLKMKVVYICLSLKDEIGADEVIWDASPIDFVKFIKNAAFVCTNSFHATAFSIIFNKRFCVVANKVRNSRMTNVLEKTGMEKRIIYQSDKVSIESVMTGNNENRISNYLEQLSVQDSIDYLNQALGVLKV